MSHPKPNLCSSTALSPKSVPFLWEEQPGISKQEFPRKESREENAAPRLPVPPPSPNLSTDSSYFPSLFCHFNSLAKIIHGNRSTRKEDPFVAAYLECTKSVKKSKEKRRYSGLRFFNCKPTVGGVREDAIVSLSRSRVLHERGT
ncbi:uncharacterized protein A4U43_C07F25770 [Asparagus officinalis]|uniref:Uncharacterized protein n=1 Tax=Asparagus officinalis TaxID=4686 RepID=A0A5P1EEX4_ASPOF|nr:uncharacterized protein A4U43_C07F25770 [Asparagus officinalis]